MTIHIKRWVKHGVVALMIFSAILGCLAGCKKSNNPLLNPDTLDESGKIIAEAAYYGEKKLMDQHALSDWTPWSLGSLYKVCQQGETSKSNCEKLYPLMLKYIRYQNHYEHTTLSDLKSPETWKTLHDMYEQFRFEEVGRFSKHTPPD